jgi:hypothetical protein
VEIGNLKEEMTMCKGGNVMLKVIRTDYSKKGSIIEDVHIGRETPKQYILSNNKFCRVKLNKSELLNLFSTSTFSASIFYLEEDEEIAKEIWNDYWKKKLHDAQMTVKLCTEVMI